MPRHIPYSATRARAAEHHDIAAAEAEQRSLAARVQLPTAPIPTPRTVVGLDISYAVGSDRVVVAAVVVDFATGDILVEATLEGTASFPYVPGLLAFREVPLLLRVLACLKTDPDLLLCDGQGLAHPARCGLASHLGVLLDKPSIGSAKAHYVGAYDEPGPKRGDRAVLVDNGETVGYVLRTQDGVKPIYVSPGHRISFDQAADIVLHLSPKHRVPNPVRFADQISRRVLREQPAPDQDSSGDPALPAVAGDDCRRGGVGGASAEAPE